MFDHFTKSCADHSLYPANLNRKDIPSAVLKAQKDRLWDDDERLFDAAVSCVAIREAVHGDDRKY